MARQISEIQSIPFHQIIGAPLLALVQGQAQAAQAMAEFIERVGFQRKENDQNGGGLGDLKMVSFRHQKPGVDGEIQTFKTEIPLLSMVPIPALEIKSADLEFFIKITDIQTAEAKTSVKSDDAEAGDWLSTGRVEFRGVMGRMESTTSDQRRIDLQMKVKLSVGQADIPVGLAHIFQTMDQSIGAKQIASPESDEKPTSSPEEPDSN